MIELYGWVRSIKKKDITIQLAHKRMTQEDKAHTLKEYKRLLSLSAKFVNALKHGSKEEIKTLKIILDATRAALMGKK